MTTEHRFYDPLKAKMIIGSLIREPELFESDKAKALNQYDFVDPLHRLVFFTLYNLFQEGHSELNGALVDGYLSERPKMFKMFHENGGYEFVNDAVDVAIPSSFGIHVDRIKKFSILRNLESIGLDVSFIYDWDTEDEARIQYQTELIDSKEPSELGALISDRIDEEIEKASSSFASTARAQGGEGLSDLLETFKETPEMGSPLHGKIMNTIVRGARLGKFYLRSSPTGGGKSRAMMADTVGFAVGKLYDHKNRVWMDNGVREPSLFITTELDIEECQTLAISYVTDMEEDKFLDYNFEDWEKEVMREGIQELEEAPFWIEHIPDFSIAEIERIIRRNVRENGVKYVA